MIKRRRENLTILQRIQVSIWGLFSMKKFWIFIDALDSGVSEASAYKKAKE